MGWTDLGEPKPRPTPLPHVPIAWPDGIRKLLSDRIPETPKFSEVSFGRRSRRGFSPLSDDDLGALFALTCKTQRFGKSDQGLSIQQRPCPSAGALHPVHLIIIDSLNHVWRRYDSRTHALVEVRSRLSPRLVLGALQTVADAQSGTFLILAAEPGITAAKYSAPDSLIWRDAGVLLGVMALAAEALSLRFCPLGTTANECASNLLEEPGLVGVGAAFMGTAPS